eukprot:comp22254_c0_seq1/m.32877 comp22254_c0_seq1/g.32877  ORF comp22254_c0_seq1/g.32877 comp22254_c0_seq1/m.32877 type:complete len:239 (-) comp22254_c0_seq1:921-1637(-)
MAQYDDTVVAVDERAPLIKPKEERNATLIHGHLESVPIESTPLWMFFHFIGFFIGGTTFIAGTSLYYYPEWAPGAEWSGWLYTIGSCGFLLVDVMEFFTFTSDFLLRVNISLSMIGSTWYIIGSIGFIPEVAEKCTWIGVWGFILGSFFIGSSQLWKTYRIGATHGGLFASLSAATQVGVELSAGLGGWSFFVGTLMYQQGPLEGLWYSAILAIWMAGSCFFTNGALFLGYRHAIMGE